MPAGGHAETVVGESGEEVSARLAKESSEWLPRSMTASRRCEQQQEQSGRVAMQASEVQEVQEVQNHPIQGVGRPVQHSGAASAAGCRGSFDSRRPPPGHALAVVLLLQPWPLAGAS